MILPAKRPVQPDTPQRPPTFLLTPLTLPITPSRPLPSPLTMLQPRRNATGSTKVSRNTSGLWRFLIPATDRLAASPEHPSD